MFEFCREKMFLDQERTQKAADIRIRAGEVQTLQKELDGVNSTVTKLENQKSDAQRKLDELDDRVSLHDVMLWIHLHQ